MIKFKTMNPEIMKARKINDKFLRTIYASIHRTHKDVYVDVEKGYDKYFFIAGLSERIMSIDVVGNIQEESLLKTKEAILAAYSNAYVVDAEKECSLDKALDTYGSLIDFTDKKLVVRTPSARIFLYTVMDKTKGLCIPINDSNLELTVLPHLNKMTEVINDYDPSISLAENKKRAREKFEEFSKTLRSIS